LRKLDWAIVTELAEWCDSDLAHSLVLCAGDPNIQYF
jgi:hypothetical protein